MKYVLVFLDIICCLFFTCAAITAASRSIMINSVVLALFWAATTVLHILTYFKKEK